MWRQHSAHILDILGTISNTVPNLVRAVCKHIILLSEKSVVEGIGATSLISRELGQGEFAGL